MKISMMNIAFFLRGNLSTADPLQIGGQSL